MNVLYTVIIKTLVVQFYRKNTGFFFMLLALTADVLRSEEHYYIIMAALHSYFLLGTFILVWSLYLIKTINFTVRTLRESQNQFLYQLYLYSFTARILGFLLVYVLQCMPFLLYMGITMSLGMAHQRIVSAGICLVYILLSALLTVFIYLRELKFPGAESGGYMLIPTVHHTFQKPPYTLFFFDVIHHHKISFLMTKLTTCLIVILAAKLYMIESFDIRFMHFILMMVGLAHVVLVYYMHHFENKKLSLQRNLPWPLLKRFLMHTTTILLILLPEIAIYVRYFFNYFNLIEIVQGILLILSITVLLYSYLYISAVAIEIFVRRVFLVALIYFFMILFGSPMIFLIFLNIVAAYFIFHRYYYLFEYNIPDE